MPSAIYSSVEVPIYKPVYEPLKIPVYKPDINYKKVCVANALVVPISSSDCDKEGRKSSTEFVEILGFQLEDVVSTKPSCSVYESFNSALGTVFSLSPLIAYTVRDSRFDSTFSPRNPHQKTLENRHCNYHGLFYHNPADSVTLQLPPETTAIIFSASSSSIGIKSVAAFASDGSTVSQRVDSSASLKSNFNSSALYGFLAFNGISQRSVTIASGIAIAQLKISNDDICVKCCGRGSLANPPILISKT